MDLRALARKSRFQWAKARKHGSVGKLSLCVFHRKFYRMRPKVLKHVCRCHFLPKPCWHGHLFVELWRPVNLLAMGEDCAAGDALSAKQRLEAIRIPDLQPDCCTRRQLCRGITKSPAG